MINDQIKALQTADEYLVRLKSGVNDVVDLINDDKNEEACELIPLISEGLDWLIKVIILTKESQKDEILISDSSEHLNEIVEGLDSKDYMLVGDLFNYEILPILDRVHIQIKEILK